MELVNKALAENPDLRALLARSSARYIYYQGGKSGQDKYFWTTKKVNHKGKPRYVAGIYRYLKTKKQWKMVKKIGFAKRYKAKQWASDAHEASK